MADLIDLMNSAYRRAEYWRMGSMAYIVLLDWLVANGFYAIDRKSDEVIAWYNGVRFSL